MKCIKWSSLSKNQLIISKLYSVTIRKYIIINSYYCSYQKVCSHMFMSLQLRIIAFDSAVSYQTDESTVIINMVRNENPPIFIEEPYVTTIAESFAIGQSVYRITATDADGVSCSCLLGDNTFVIE